MRLRARGIGRHLVGAGSDSHQRWRDSCINGRLNRLLGRGRRQSVACVIARAAVDKIDVRPTEPNEEPERLARVAGGVHRGNGSPYRALDGSRVPRTTLRGYGQSIVLDGRCAPDALLLRKVSIVTHDGPVGIHGFAKANDDRRTVVDNLLVEHGDDDRCRIDTRDSDMDIVTVDDTALGIHRARLIDGLLHDANGVRGTVRNLARMSEARSARSRNGELFGILGRHRHDQRADKAGNAASNLVGTGCRLRSRRILGAGATSASQNGKTRHQWQKKAVRHGTIIGLSTNLLNPPLSRESSSCPLEWCLYGHAPPAVEIPTCRRLLRAVPYSGMKRSESGSLAFCRSSRQSSNNSMRARVRRVSRPSTASGGRIR